MSAIAPETAAPRRTFAQIEAILAQALPGYKERPRQQQLALNIEQTLDSDDGRVLVAQAGTGTGKSLAGLIPASESDGRTVIAVPTKALQQQYVKKDIPFLLKHVNPGLRAAEIMGRVNYPCRAKIKDLDGKALTPAQHAAIEAVAALEPGEVVNREGLPAMTNKEWAMLGMPSSECPGSRQCPFGKKRQCVAEWAKVKAAAAQIVVTNLAYLATDLKLRKESEGQVSLLGPIERLIIDEGHEFDSAVTQALSVRIAHGTFTKLAGDAAAFLRDYEEDPDLGSKLGYYGQLLWEALVTEFRRWQKVQTERKASADQMPLPEALREAMLGQAMRVLTDTAGQLAEQIDQITPYEEHQDRQMRLLRRLTSMRDRLHEYMADPDTETVRWIEEDEDRRVYLCGIPVLPAKFLNEMIWSLKVPVVIMSATLAAGRDADGRPDFSYPVKTLGLPKDRLRTFEAPSPFNYKENAMLYIPDADAPHPRRDNDSAWRSFASERSRELVEASGGGAFLLFTSRRGMDQAWNSLGWIFKQMGLTVLKQDDAVPSVLIEQFKKDGNAVLLGLRTYMQGVDVPGRDLRLVIIDKLPFPVPSDLQFDARCKAANRAAGRDVSFRELSMPMMTWPLLQAAGRLLRQEDDRGVMAIMDPRLSSKGYGADVKRALPPARLTTDPAVACAFLKAGRP